MKAVIVTPTLDLAAAAASCEHARQIGGVDCGIVLVSDYAKRGAVAPTNAGLAAALQWATEYIVHLNDDATPGPLWLARLIEALEENPRYGIAAPSGPCRSKPQCDGYPGMPRATVVVDHPLANFCSVVRAQLYRDLGLHDPNLIHYADESDFSMRARAAGWLEIYVQDIFVDHRVVERGDGKLNEWWTHDRDYYKRKWRKG